MDKQFKTIDEQLKILEDRKLTIDDRDAAKCFLLENNYYRVSGYSLTLRRHDIFYPKATFQNIIDIYNFDKEFRIILLDIIHHIEITSKSVYVYQFTKIHGGLGYLNPSLFSDKTAYDSTLEKVAAQVNRRLSHEAFLKHFVKELKEPIPLWAYIDLFTISDFSKLFRITESDIKNSVALHFGLTHKNAGDTFEAYLRGLSILRNLCAHGSRLYNRLFVTKPNLNKMQISLLRKNRKGYPDNSKLFGYILIMKRITNENVFKRFFNQLDVLCKKYPFVNMKYYGFCDNWSEVLNKTIE